MTARVSGEASALRVTDCNSAPATPRAKPTATPASRRGRRDPVKMSRPGTRPPTPRAPTTSAADRDADAGGALRQVPEAHRGDRDEKRRRRPADRRRARRPGSRHAPSAGAPSAARSPPAVTGGCRLVGHFLVMSVDVRVDRLLTGRRSARAPHPRRERARGLPSRRERGPDRALLELGRRSCPAAVVRGEEVRLADRGRVPRCRSARDHRQGRRPVP